MTYLESQIGLIKAHAIRQLLFLFSLALLRERVGVRVKKLIQLYEMIIIKQDFCWNINYYNQSR